MWWRRKLVRRRRGGRMSGPLGRASRLCGRAADEDVTPHPVARAGRKLRLPAAGRPVLILKRPKHSISTAGCCLVAAGCSRGAVAEPAAALKAQPPPRRVRACAAQRASPPAESPAKRSLALRALSACRLPCAMTRARRIGAVAQRDAARLGATHQPHRRRQPAQRGRAAAAPNAPGPTWSERKRRATCGLQRRQLSQAPEARCEMRDVLIAERGASASRGSGTW